MVSLSLCKGRGIRGFIRAFGKEIWIYPAKYALLDRNKINFDHDIYDISVEHVIYSRPHSYQHLNEVENIRRKQRRLATYNNGDNVVEIYILADKTLVDYWKNRAGSNWFTEMVQFLKDMINTVDSYFQNTDWGYDIGSISVKFVSLDIVESWSGIFSEISGWQYETYTGYLDKFMPWYKTYKDINDFDYAMIYASNSYFRNEGNIGYSWLTSICDDTYNCGMMSNTWESLFNVRDQSELFAHELGHNLGAQHDNSGYCSSYNIDPNTDIMMSNIGENAFSTCSIAYIQQAFSDNNGFTCLNNRYNPFELNGQQQQDDDDDDDTGSTPTPQPTAFVDIPTPLPTNNNGDNNDKVLIFFDTFSNLNLWHLSSPTDVVLYTDGTCIGAPITNSYDCALVKGKEGSDRWMIRTISNTYSSYTLILDVITWDLYNNKYEYCKISYSFDFYNWVALGLYGGVSNGAWTPYKNSQFTFSNSDPSQNTLFIKLEAVGQDPYDLYDYCVFDNVYLYGSS